MMRYVKSVTHSAMGKVEMLNGGGPHSLVPDPRRVHNNLVVDILEIVEAMLDCALEYRRGNHGIAFDHLRRSVALDNSLAYDKPWGWVQPARHALGALLMEQNQFKEAEAVYRADLCLDDMLNRASQHPNNLWSLHGLHECPTRRGETVESRLIKQQLDQALAKAEGKVHTYCFCRQQAAA